MKKIILVVPIIFLVVCALKSVVPPPLQKILFVVSNARFYGQSDIRTANHFEEIIRAYDVFDNAGYVVDFVSPEGGSVPIGYINSDTMMTRYLYNADFMKLLKDTKVAREINPDDYAAIFYAGGGAAMFGVPSNEDIQGIARDIYELNGGIVSAVCHGTAGIANIKRSDGSYLVADKRISGFPDLFENKTAAYYKTFPFSIEEIINTKGGKFTYSKKGWDNHYIVDGRLVTGQDPSATITVSQKVIELLEK